MTVVPTATPRVATSTGVSNDAPKRPNAQRSASETPTWYPSPVGGDERLRYGLRSDVKEQRNKSARQAHDGPMPAPLESVPSYFRNAEQIRDALFALQEKYPDLVTVDDIGDSGEKVRGVA
ncbi:MAG: hypothetical protein AAFQ82_19900, partial [Myxococcota bacterium]